MPRISLPQKNLILDAASGENLMDFLIKNQIPVASSCLGEGICSMCRVKIKGELSSPSEFEKRTLVRNKCADDERLSCQIVIATELEVETKYW